MNGSGSLPGLRSRADFGCAAFLVGLAAAVRLRGLTSHGLYRDDAWVVLATRADIGETVRLGVTIPGFELAIRAWAGLNGSTMWAQTPELAASVVAVVVAYFVARRLGCGRPASLVAGGILALSPIALIFATRVKPYSFDLLNCVLVLALAMRVIQKPTWARSAVLGVFSLAGVVFSASLLPATLTAVAWCGWLGVRQRATGAVVVACTYVAVVGAYALVVLANVPPSLQTFWTPNYITGASSAVAALNNFAAGIFYRHGPAGWPLLLLIAAGVVWARRDLAPLFLGPVAIGLGLAVLKRAPFGGGRTDMYLYPCIAFAAALGVEKLLGARMARAGAAPALVLAAGLCVVALVDGRREIVRNPYPGADLAELSAMVDQHRAPGDGVVVAPFSRYAFAIYSKPDPKIILSSQYSTRFTVASPDPDVFLMPAEFYEGGYDPEAPAAFAAGRHRVWYIATDTPPSDTPPEVQDHEYEPERRLIAAGYVIEQRVDVFGAHADLLVSPGD